MIQPAWPTARIKLLQEVMLTRLLLECNHNLSKCCSAETTGQSHDPECKSNYKHLPTLHHSSCIQHCIPQIFKMDSHLHKSILWMPISQLMLPNLQIKDTIFMESTSNWKVLNLLCNDDTSFHQRLLCRKEMDAYNEMMKRKNRTRRYKKLNKE